MKKILLGIFCTMIVILMAGCAGKQVEKTADQLAQEGERHFEDEKYRNAIEAYKRLKDWYPYSPHARKALLRVADSHYHLEEYEEAIFGYEQYEQLYPNDPEVPYVIYRIGLCHFDRMKTIDRTQVPARNALETFERLKSRFPASHYAEKAGQKIEKCLENIAGHEFYVGRFYFKSGHYKAAASRFQNVVDLYPDHLEVHKEAVDYLAMAETRLEKQDAPPETPETGAGAQDRPFADTPSTSPAPGPIPTPAPTPE